MARRPDETFNFGVDYYGIDKLHIGAYGEYIGERYDALGKTGAQTGKYTVVNLVTDYEISKSTSMYFKIENLFDREYQLVDTYAAAPRSLSVGLKTTF